MKYILMAFMLVGLITSCTKEIEVEKIVYQEDLTKINQLKEQVVDLQNEIDVLSSINVQLQNNLDGIVSVYEAELLTLTQELNSSVGDLSQLEQKIIELSDDIKELETAILEYDRDTTLHSLENVFNLDVLRYDPVTIGEQIFIVTGIRKEFIQYSENSWGDVYVGLLYSEPGRKPINISFNFHRETKKIGSISISSGYSVRDEDSDTWRYTRIIEQSQIYRGLYQTELLFVEAIEEYVELAFEEWNEYYNN